jgi:hypothetical protein
MPFAERANLDGDMMTHMMPKLRDILKRAETWPEATQDEAVELLLALEEERAGPAPLTTDDHEALARSGEDVRRRRFAPDEAVKEVFDRHRGR